MLLQVLQGILDFLPANTKWAVLSSNARLTLHNHEIHLAWQPWQLSRKQPYIVSPLDVARSAMHCTSTTSEGCHINNWLYPTDDSLFGIRQALQSRSWGRMPQSGLLAKQSFRDIQRLTTRSTPNAVALRRRIHSNTTRKPPRSPNTMLRTNASNEMNLSTRWTPSQTSSLCPVFESPSRAQQVRLSGGRPRDWPAKQLVPHIRKLRQLYVQRPCRLQVPLGLSEQTICPSTMPPAAYVIACTRPTPPISDRPAAACRPKEETRSTCTTNIHMVWTGSHTSSCH